MELFYLFLGLLFGAIITALYLKNKAAPLDADLSKKLIDFEKTIALNNEKLSNKQNELNETKIVLSNQLKNEEQKFFTQLSDLKNESAIEKAKLNEDLAFERKKNEEAVGRVAKAEEVFKYQKQKIDELTGLLEEQRQTHKQDLEEIHKRLTSEFENIANKVLEEKSQKFTTQNKENIDGILSPLRERLKDFSEKVEKSYNEENKDRAALKKEIEMLVTLNKQVSEEANNLARALKGDTKKQGNWGEVILERVLERSGLIKGQEYDTQFTTQNNEGNTIKPDVVVYLPDGKHIIIDSKVSLKAYEQLSNCVNEDERHSLLNQHIISVRTHIKGLSDKNYQTAKGLITPDFVLLFIPVEASFSVAIQADEDLFNYAWDRKIVMVSPSTLLATLKTIASVWKQEKQNKNALEIANQATDLIDKFSGFAEDLIKAGSKLDDGKHAFDEAVKKLHTGKGNIVNRLKNIEKLGIKGTKNIPDALMPDEETEN